MTEDKGAKSFNRWDPDYIKRQKDKVRRERIATACLQGLLADPDFIGNEEIGAKAALAYADALIAELDKKETP